MPRAPPPPPYHCPSDTLSQSDCFCDRSKTTSLKYPRGDKAGAALNGRVFVVGGETRGASGQVVPLTDVETFNPLTKKWTKAGDIPSHRFRFTAASVGSSIFVFGGQGYLVGTENTVGSYFPVLDTVEKFEETVKIVPTIELNFNLLYLGLTIVAIIGFVAFAARQHQTQVPKSSSASSGADVAQKV